MPACDSVNVCPAAVMVALRDEVDEFDVTLNTTVPLPLPDAPPVIVTQFALLAAVHAHPLGAVTLKLLVPPLWTIDCVVGEIE